MRLSIERTVKGLLPHLTLDGILYCSSATALYSSMDHGATWERLARIHRGWRALLARLRPVDRVLRLSLFVAHVSGTGPVFAVSARNAFIGDRSDSSLVRASRSPIDFRPLRRGLCVTSKGTLYVGEYRDNFGEYRRAKEREPVHIWRSDDCGQTFEVAYRFPRGSIRHVHAILEDPYVPDRIWVTSGDEDDESAISFTDDDWRTIQPFKSGSQRYRVTDLSFSEDEILWGMDSPRQQSLVIRCDRRTGTEEALGAAPCPLYYTARNEAGHFFVTDSVEPGPAVTSDWSSLYGIGPSDTLEQLAAFQSDRTPQYAQIHLPLGCMPQNYVYFYPRCTRIGDHTLYVGRVTD